MSTDPIGIDPCPHCRTTSGVKVKVITGTPPKVRGWSCSAFGTDWWISVVNPRPCLDQLAVGVDCDRSSRWREWHQHSGDNQLRARLLDLAKAARPALEPAGCRCG